MMHDNSLEAYSYGNKTGGLSDRAALVLGKIRELGICTDREVRDALGFKEMNAVRPRITEMLKSGYLEEVDSITDPKTGRPGRRTRVRIIPQVKRPSRNARLKSVTRQKPVEMRQASLFAEESQAHHWGF